jgi:hypothetical protein
MLPQDRITRVSLSLAGAVGLAFVALAAVRCSHPTPAAAAPAAESKPAEPHAAAVPPPAAAPTPTPPVGDAAPSPEERAAFARKVAK